jgi:hypothetical protein
MRHFTVSLKATHNGNAYNDDLDRAMYIAEYTSRLLKGAGDQLIDYKEVTLHDVQLAGYELTYKQVEDILEVLDSAQVYAAYVQQENEELHKDASPTVLGSDKQYVPRLMEAISTLRQYLHETNPTRVALTCIQEKEDFVTERAEQFLNRKYDQS